MKTRLWQVLSVLVIVVSALGAMPQPALAQEGGTTRYCAEPVFYGLWCNRWVEVSNPPPVVPQATAAPAQTDPNGCPTHSGDYRCVGLANGGFGLVLASQAAGMSGQFVQTTVYSASAIPVYSAGYVVLAYLVPASLVLNPNQIQHLVEGSPRMLQPDGSLTVYQNGQVRTIQLVRVAEVRSQCQETGQGCLPTPQPQKVQPPPEQYCGENMKRYFSLFMLDQLLALVVRDQIRIGNYSSMPIEADWMSKYNPEYQAIGQRLREKGCFDNMNGSGHSVFMNYKNVRDSRFAEKELNQWRLANLNKDMSTDQAFEIILKMVSGWWQ